MAADPSTTLPDNRPTASLDGNAVAMLRYIRDTMESAQGFTSVSGRGCIVMGGIALVAASIATIPQLEDAWLMIWVTSALLAVGLNLPLMSAKAKAQGSSLKHQVARRFFLTLTPPILMAAVLTVALSGATPRELIVGIWLLSYGAALATSGVFSIGPVTLAGLAFMCLGAVTVFMPPGWALPMLALGFGLFHLALGLVIARRFGG
jgi:hypothetical protein